MFFIAQQKLHAYAQSAPNSRKNKQLPVIPAKAGIQSG